MINNISVEQENIIKEIKKPEKDTCDELLKVL